MHVRTMNNHQSQPSGAKQSILEKIRKGDVKMRPKAYFILKIILVVFVSVCILVVSSLLMSFIMFSIGVSGKLFLLGFGWRGIVTFFALFPWGFSVIDVLLLFLFEWMLKQFRFAYHRPLIYMFLGSILLSFLAGFVINGFGVQDALLQQNDEHPIPVIGSLYEHVRMPSEKKDVFQGVVSSINGNVFTIQANDYDHDADDGIRKVVAPPDDQIGSSLKVGDKVFVAGDEQNGTIYAYGIKQIGPHDGDGS